MYLSFGVRPFFKVWQTRRWQWLSPTTTVCCWCQRSAWGPFFHLLFLTAFHVEISTLQLSDKFLSDNITVWATVASRLDQDHRGHKTLPTCINKTINDSGYRSWKLQIRKTPQGLQGTCCCGCSVEVFSIFFSLFSVKLIISRHFLKLALSSLATSGCNHKLHHRSLHTSKPQDLGMFFLLIINCNSSWKLHMCIFFSL